MPPYLILTEIEVAKNPPSPGKTRGYQRGINKSEGKITTESSLITKAAEPNVGSILESLLIASDRNDRYEELFTQRHEFLCAKSDCKKRPLIS